MELRRSFLKRARSLLVTGAFVALVSPALAAATAQEPAAPTAGVNPVIQPGDKVRLRIWREPDLSGEFVVDESGIVVFPRLGRLEVRQLSADSLRALLVAHYSSSLRDPAVEVTVLRRVSVLGAVRNPGLYYVDPTITVAGVLALAGGVSPEGNQNRFDLLRGGERLQVRLSEQSGLADSSIEPGDQLWVPERSWLSRNTWLLSASVTAVAIVVAAIIRY
jgi:polysaccharide export outer membrane protein